MAKRKAKEKQYRLTWLRGRSTPVVTPVGQKRRKTAGGKVVASRLANATERKAIRAGRWVRSRPPGQSGKQSSIRKFPRKRRKK